MNNICQIYCNYDSVYGNVLIVALDKVRVGYEFVVQVKGRALFF